MKYLNIPIIFVAAAMTMPTLAVADDDDELEFDEAQLYFELNDTDGDLGIHGKVDGEEWKWVAIEDPNERRIMYVLARGGVRQQGLTELFFESAEPTFDDLDPEVFFNRFPEGLYEWEGKTLDWKEIEGEVFLSHVIPAAPEVLRVGMDKVGPGEDECWEPDTDGGVTIRWGAVTESHFEKWTDEYGDPVDEDKIPLGDSGDVEVLYYEFVAEIDGTDLKATAILPPDVTKWRVPKRFINLADGLTVEDEDTEMQVPVEEIKFEIIVRVESGEGTDDDGETIESRPGNQSAVEDCFEIKI